MIPNEINYIYGLPSYITKINPKLYEKKKILSQIEKNYKVSKVRDKWSLDSFIKTDIHHSLEDEKNPKFKTINYSTLRIVSIFFSVKLKIKPHKHSFPPNFICRRST